MKTLGNYIEIEYKGTNKDIDEVLLFLNEILKKIGADVGPTDYKGYAYHIFNKKCKR